MGFLKKSRIKSGKDLYETKVKPELAKKMVTFMYLCSIALVNT